MASLTNFFIWVLFDKNLIWGIKSPSWRRIKLNVKVSLNTLFVPSIEVKVLKVRKIGIARLNQDILSSLKQNPIHDSIERKEFLIIFSIKKYLYTFIQQESVRNLEVRDAHNRRKETWLHNVIFLNGQPNFNKDIYQGN